MFDAVKVMSAWNKCVDVHKASGKAKSQLRPYIFGISNLLKPDPDIPQAKLHTVWYGNGMSFPMEEIQIQSYTQSYTTLVAQETGNKSIIFTFEEEE